MTNIIAWVIIGVVQWGYLVHEAQKEYNVVESPRRVLKFTMLLLMFMLFGPLSFPVWLISMELLGVKNAED